MSIFETMYPRSTRITATAGKKREMTTDWIKTFPNVFDESHRTVLALIEKAGFERGIQVAAKVAASYALENADADSMCREIAREISEEGGLNA